MGCGTSLPEQENESSQLKEAPSKATICSPGDNDAPSSTSSRSPSPSSSSSNKDKDSNGHIGRKRKSSTISDGASPIISVAPQKEEIRKEQELKLEQERERVRVELERIRSGVNPAESAGTMGVVNSSLQGTRVGSPNHNNNNNDLSKEIAIDRHTLESYLRLEKEIAVEETTSPLQPLDLKTSQLQRLITEVEEKELALKDLEAQTAAFGKEDGDVAYTKNFFIENEVQEESLSKSQEEYLDVVNKKEIAEQELQAARKQKDQVQEEVVELEKAAQSLQELYKKQDQLLDRMFGGSYGSMLENKLEQELDTLEAHRGRVLEANFKWRQAQMMLEYACKQLAVAVQKWQDLPTLPTIDLEVRYSVAAETRNNLVAAGQNLHGAQRYLDAVQFPYCDSEEVATLNKQATEYVFTDMQSADRHSHAQNCYNTSHKRANALLQWFDTVINTTIMHDLTEINEKVKAKTLELRKERVRLIKAKLRELSGSDVDLDETLRDPDVDIQSMARAMMNSAQAVRVNGSEVEGSRANTPPLLSNSELAPMPSNNEIFGNMYDHYQDQLEHIAQQHQNELQTFIKEQENKQQKIRGSLEEKLALRRQRRALQNLESAQKNALVTSE